MSERYPGNDIHETAIIYEGVLMGTGNTIGPYCIIGGPPEWRGHYESSGRVVIGDGNRFTKLVTIDSGANRLTLIGDGCTLLAGAHVGHDVQIGDGVTISCHALIGGNSMVGAGCNFGLGAVMHQGVYLPPRCMVGMNTTITKKTPLEEGVKYVGSPARILGPNVRT